MNPKIVLVQAADADIEIARDMQPSGFDVVIANPGTPEFQAALPDMKYLIGLGDGRVNDAFYQAAPNLRLVQLLSAGYDKCDIEAARRAGVPIANNGGANAVAVAEHTLHADARGLPPADLAAQPRRRRALARQRPRGQSTVYEMHGKTLGIIGLGTIGKKVARLGRAFGMPVQYYDVTATRRGRGGCARRAVPACSMRC